MEAALSLGALKTLRAQVTIGVAAAAEKTCEAQDGGRARGGFKRVENTRLGTKRFGEECRTWELARTEVDGPTPGRRWDAKAHVFQGDG